MIRRSMPEKDCNQKQAHNDKQYCTAGRKNPSTFIDADEAQAEALRIRPRPQTEVIVA